MEIIIGRHGNQKLAITDTTVSREHCKLLANDDGSFTLENLSSSGTKVGGVSVIRTTVHLNDTIQLGPTFTATIAELIGTEHDNPGNEKAQKNADAHAQSSYKKDELVVSIFHLQDVYNTFEENKLRIQTEARQRANSKNFSRMIPSFILTAISVLVIIIGPGIGSLKLFLGVVSGLALLYSALKWKNADTEDIEENNRNVREFQTKWVCPHCKNPLPSIPYDAIVNKGSCSYCKAKWKA